MTRHFSANKTKIMHADFWSTVGLKPETRLKGRNKQVDLAAFIA